MSTMNNLDLVKVCRLLDFAKLRGFTFHSDVTGAGGPLVGRRVSEEWTEETEEV